MAISSCDHGNYVVVYEFFDKSQCPVCAEALEKDAALESLIRELDSEKNQE